MSELYNPELFKSAKSYTFGQVMYIYDGATASNGPLPSYAVYAKYIKKNDEWELVSGERYWRPYMPDDTSFRLLLNNYPTIIEDLRKKTNIYKAEQNATANIAPGKAATYNPGTRHSWPVGSNGALYIATDTTVDFSSLRWNQPNPYNTSSIRVWIKSGSQYANTLETGTTYWFNPVTKSFLPIPMLVASVGTTQTAYQLSIREGKILAAIASGLSRAAAEAKIDSAVSTIKNGTAGGGAVANNNNNMQKTTPITKVKVRGNFGYLGIGEKEGSSPQMVQMYSLPEDVRPRVARHIFNITPGQISYSNLGSDWQEIERVGQVGLIDWKNYKLMKISFQFLIVPDKSATYDRLGGFSDNATNSTITVGVDDKIRNLRAMATRPFPIALYGFDDMMTNQLRFPADKGRGVEFVIGDLNISSIFRTENGEINRATCDITLQEVPLEAIRIIEMPKLIPEKIRTKPEEPPPPEYGERRLLTTDLGDPAVSKNIELNG
jgi:hypothetical protein